MADQIERNENPSNAELPSDDELKKLTDIGRIIAASLSTNEAFEEFAKLVNSLVPHDRLAMAAITADSMHVDSFFVSGVEIDHPEESQRVAIPAGRIREQMFVEFEQYHAVDDQLNELLELVDDEKYRVAAGLRSVLSTPLVWQGQPQGVMTLRSFDPNAFGPREKMLAKLIARQISGTVAMSRQLITLEKQIDENRKLADYNSHLSAISRVLSSTSDPQEAFEKFVEQLRGLIKFDRIVIASLDHDRAHLHDEFVSGIRFAPVVPDGTIPAPEEQSEVYQTVFENLEQFVLDGEGMRARAKAVHFERSRLDAGLMSMLMTPLVWQGEAIGVITLRSFDERGYGVEEMRIARDVATQVAGALAMVKQYGELASQSARNDILAEQQSKLAEIGRIVSSTLDLEDVLSAFVDVARTLVPFDRVVVTVVDEDMSGVTDVLVDGLRLGKERLGISYPLRESQIQSTVIMNQEVLVANGPKYLEIVERSPAEKLRYELGARSLLMAPLIWQGRTFGTLNLRSKDPEAYGKDQRELAEQIAAQIAGAIATSNQYALIEKESAEREKLAEQQAKIAEIGRIVSSSLEIEDVLSAFVEVARTLVPFDRIVVTVFDENMQGVTDVLVDGLTLDNETIGISYPLSESRIQMAVIQSQETRVANGSEYRELTENSATEKVRHNLGARSLLMAPLVWQGRAVGTLNLRSKDPQAYGESQRELAEQIAAQIAGAISTSQQFTLLDRAQEMLRTQAAVFEAAGESITIVRPDRTIEYVNDAFIEETGFTREEVIDQSVKIVRVPGQDATYDEIWEHVETGKRWSGIVDAVNKNGDVYPIESSITPVMDEDGQIVRFVGIRRNISDRVQAEEDRTARMRLDVENRELAEIARQREEFFSSVSHELRTPLTAIMSFADILSRDRQGTLTGLQLEHLDVIKRNSRSLNELVEDMLDFSRLSTNRLKLDRSDVEVHALVESVVESMEPTIRAKSQQVEVVSAPVPVWINADSGRITQVISNLMANSSKYSESGSKIRVELELINDYAHIKVVDQGVGISEAELGEIFTPFFRSKREDVQIQPGTGLGLAISKTLIELHDGQIQISSIENEGSTFTVILPVTSHK